MVPNSLVTTDERKFRELQLTPGDLSTLIDRVVALFPDDTNAQATITAKYGTKHGDFGTVNELLAAPDLPATLYDLKVVVARTNYSGAFDGYIIIDRWEEVTLAVRSSNEVWTYGVTKAVDLLLRKFEVPTPIRAPVTPLERWNAALQKRFSPAWIGIIIGVFVSTLFLRHDFYVSWVTALILFFPWWLSLPITSSLERRRDKKYRSRGVVVFVQPQSTLTRREWNWNKISAVATLIGLPIAVAVLILTYLQMVKKH